VTHQTAVNQNHKLKRPYKDSQTTTTKPNNVLVKIFIGHLFALYTSAPHYQPAIKIPRHRAQKNFSASRLERSGKTNEIALRANHLQSITSATQQIHVNDIFSPKRLTRGHKSRNLHCQPNHWQPPTRLHLAGSYLKAKAHRCRITKRHNRRLQYHCPPRQVAACSGPWCGPSHGSSDTRRGNSHEALGTRGTDDPSHRSYGRRRCPCSLVRCLGLG
jgi:hypothetical protein